MIDVFYYSIAGKKQNQVIDDLIQQFIESPVIPKKEKDILRHIQEVSKFGTYPSKEYFSTFYSVPPFRYKALAEIVNYSHKCLDFYLRQDIQRRVVSSFNDATDSTTLLNELDNIVNTSVAQEDSDVELSYTTYGETLKTPLNKGFLLGVPEIDSITNGFQPANIASICGFVAHGKSSYLLSSIYKNIRLGKKGILASLEIEPRIVWLQLQTRYLYEEKGLQITVDDLLQRKLSKDLEEQVLSFEEDFKNDIVKNVAILDESSFPKQVVLDYKSLSRKLRTVDKKLGGLDFIAFDHIGQFELLYPDCGNQIIKQIQSFTKTYTDSKGNKPVTIFAVQTNREGAKRATKRNGVYDIQAISDLNEVERSSSTIIFIYTSEDMKVVQESRATMAKNRFGATLMEPVVVSFNPAVVSVGSNVEKISFDDSDMASLGDFGDFSFGDNDDVF